MYPVGGWVMVKEIRNYWYDEEDQHKSKPHGPYRILRTMRLYEGSRLFYVLEGANMHYPQDYLEASTSEEALYHKMTSHIDEEPSHER